MIDRKTIDIGDNNTFTDSAITQQTADEINNDNRKYLTLVSQLPIAKKKSIIHEVIEGILEIQTATSPTLPDTKDYDIRDKIDHNKIRSYKQAYDMYIQQSYLIDDRLSFLNKNKHPMSSQRLYTFVKNIYLKHCDKADPDQRIHCICEEIKGDLSNDPDISIEDSSFIPIVVFYVFSKCHIFEKPPVPS